MRSLGREIKKAFDRRAAAADLSLIPLRNPIFIMRARKRARERARLFRSTGIRACILIIRVRALLALYIYMRGEPSRASRLTN